MANIHPNSIFRWEDAASLEHACWQCPTKANSPRALQTCYGVHSMPCVSYHPTMHAVGASHRCSGCIITREMHDVRHREIAELLAEYRAQETPPCVPETPTRRGPLLEIDANVTEGLGGGRSRQLTAGHQRNQNREIDFVIHEDDAESMGVATNKDDNDIGEDNENDDDDDATSLSSYAPSSTATIDQPATKTMDKKKLTKAEIRTQKKAKKSAKSASKALKNQNRNLAIVTSAEVEKVARILHGDEQDVTSDGSAHPLATDKTIEDVISRNLKFVKNIQAHKVYLFRSVAMGRKEIKERKRLRKRESRGGEPGEETIELEEVVSAIMIKLGVDPVVVAASATTCAAGSSTSATSKTSVAGFSSGRKRAASNLSLGLGTPNSVSGGKVTIPGTSRASVNVTVKLRAAIKSDLEKHENEVHARYVRAGGFWRYVGKTVFERMMAFARDTDVATGESWEKKLAREGKGGGVGDCGTDDAVDDGNRGAEE